MDDRRRAFVILCYQLNNAIHLLSNNSLCLSKGNASVKRNLPGSIFPENLFFPKERSRTAWINEAVLLIQNTSNGCGQLKTGQLFKNLTLSGEVEITGQKSNLSEELKVLNTIITK